MKLDLDPTSSLLNITSYTTDGITVGGRLLEIPFVVYGNDIHVDVVPQSVNMISVRNIEALTKFGPSIIILGTGTTQVFLDAEALHPAHDSQIGVETMNTPAACRSFNILVAENRSVMGVFYMP